MRIPDLTITLTTLLLLAAPAYAASTGLSSYDSQTPLQGVTFDFGPDIRLDRPFRQEEQPTEGCIDKPSRSAHFCLETVNWPENLHTSLTGSDVVYNGTRAILYYHQGTSVQVYILFPTDQSEAIVAYLQSRYGPPTGEQTIQIPMPGSPAVTNRLTRWRSTVAGQDTDMILEVRRLDDIRRPFPDNTHGVVRLYRQGDDSMFRYLSVIDLMVLRQRRIGRSQ